MNMQAVIKRSQSEEEEFFARIVDSDKYHMRNCLQTITIRLL